jgi:hypothetical protein
MTVSCGYMRSEIRIQGDIRGRAPWQSYYAAAKERMCVRQTSTLPVLALALLMNIVQGRAIAQDKKPPRFDYPTAARADYVIGCMAANGFQRQLLDKCACGIDVIADRLDYDDYETAETILSMQQASVGPRGGLFRDTPVARQSLEKLRRAQAEANLRCGD